jgi:hypothetical protein
MAFGRSSFDKASRISEPRTRGVASTAGRPPPALHFGMRSGRRVFETVFVAGAVVLAGGGMLVAAQAPSPPPLLADVLRARSEWRLLDPAIDLVGDYTIAQLVELDRWPPWIEMDFDRDGKTDIAAVVVRRGPGNETAFTVAVVHGGTPDRAELVVPFSPQRIFGVSEAIKDDTIMPLRCADCEANVWYRWNGRAYEPLLQAVGESLRIGGEPGQRAPLFGSPRSDAPRSAEVPHCARAQVQEVGGEEGRRWYRVEVVAPSFPRGWVPQQLVMGAGDCDR